MSDAALHSQPNVRWYLRGKRIDIMHVITDFNIPNSRVLGFHIRELETGIESDIFWNDYGEIDGFEYEEVQQ